MAELEYKITLDEIVQGLISKRDMDPIIEEIESKAVERFINNAMNAPSSPLTPKKADELIIWFNKAKEAGMKF